MYGTVHIYDHPVYDKCTLFKMGEKGLAVIQQRFDQKTKSTTKKIDGKRVLIGKAYKLKFF